MEAFSLPKRQILQNILLLSLLLYSGCSKEDEPPINGTHTTQVTKTIGSSGGTIKIDSFSVTIPPGAFRNDQILEISISDKQHPFLDQGVTDLFSVKGIPEEFLDPIIITLKYDGVLEEESYLAFGREQALDESDTTLISFDLLDCTDSSGYLVGKLLPYSQADYLKGGQGHLEGGGYDIPEELVTFFKGVTRFKTYKAQNSPFIIKYPVILALNPHFLNLVDHLHSNLEIMKDLASQTEFPLYKIPERVNVYNSQNTSNKNGKLPHFKFLINDRNKPPGIPVNEYFAYVLYKEPVDVKELNIKIGTTFFESFQRHIYFDDDFGYEGLFDWFTIASKSWIEEKFLEPWGGADMHVPEGFKGYERSPFIQWNYRRLSGMAPIVKYLAETYGEHVVFLYHHHIRNKKSMFDALKMSIGKPAEEWYPEFLRDYLEGKIYGVPGRVFVDEVTGQYELPLQNAPKSYPWQSFGLTATIFHFNTDGVTKDKTGVSFSVESQDVDPSKTDVLVFSVQRDNKKIEFIADQISDYVEIFNVRDLADQCKDILVMVVNSDYDKRQTVESKINLRVELNESLPLTYKKFSVDLIHFIGDVRYEDGTVKTFDDIHMRISMPDAIDGKFTGNEFEAKWDRPSSVFSRDSGHVTAHIIEKEGELVLNGFYFHKVFKNSDSNSQYSYRLVGGGISLFLVEGTGILAGRVEGIDIDNKLSSFGWEVKPCNKDHSPAPQSYNIQNIRFRPESYLEVYFHESDE